MPMNRLKKVTLMGLAGLNMFLSPACESSNVMDEAYIDPHIIFTSRRWWNYDIFIADIFNAHMTQLTKNKWIEANRNLDSIHKTLIYLLG